MPANEIPKPDSWTISGAETLLRSLAGVVSVRVVAKPGGEVEEIHMLTTEDVSPKQTVRNVESALLAHFDLEVDHRKISVAQSRSRPIAEPDPIPAGAPVLHPPMSYPRGPEGPLSFTPRLHSEPEPAQSEARLLFCSHQVQTERSHRVRMVVTIEWKGEEYDGEATGPDVPNSRLETMAAATLRAIEHAFESEDLATPPTLALGGVKAVDAFERGYVLVAVHAISGRNRTSLAGSAAIEDSTDLAVIMATLQATDRWVRGRL